MYVKRSSAKGEEEEEDDAEVLEAEETVVAPREEGGGGPWRKDAAGDVTEGGVWRGGEGEGWAAAAGKGAPREREKESGRFLIRRRARLQTTHAPRMGPTAPSPAVCTATLSAPPEAAEEEDEADMGGHTAAKRYRGGILIASPSRHTKLNPSEKHT